MAWAGAGQAVGVRRLPKGRGVDPVGGESPRPEEPAVRTHPLGQEWPQEGPGRWSNWQQTP